MQQHSQKYLRQRKFFMVAPLMVLPFVTLIFWALGGGKVTAKSVGEQQQKGFNLSLPSPHFKDDKGRDKMAYYDQAAIDSSKKAEKRKEENLLGFRPLGND